MGPIAATRCNRKDTKIGNHLITAGTVIFPNLYSMTRDPKLWGPSVDQFDPTRFLDENGKFKNDWWDFTFGTGNFVLNSKVLSPFFDEIMKFLTQRSTGNN